MILRVNLVNDNSTWSVMIHGIYYWINMVIEMRRFDRWRTIRNVDKRAIHESRFCLTPLLLCKSEEFSFFLGVDIDLTEKISKHYPSVSR